jgi:hypothetical protein
MLKRTVSLVFFATINNRRLFSLTTILNRQQQRNVNEINNQHREFRKFHSRSSNFKKRIQQNKTEDREEDLDIKKPRFNRYNVTRLYSKTPLNKKSLEDDENDIFSEEKDNLTILGTDKKTFSSSSTIPAQKPSTTAISLTKNSDK